MVSNRYLNVLASLFAFANVSVAQGLATQAPRIPSCTGFALSSNDTRIVALMSEPISTGVACDNSTNSITDPTCQVQSGAWLMLYNVAYLQNGSQYVGSTYQAGYGIWNATGDSEPLYGVGGRVFAVDNQTTTVSPGSSGYIVFHPRYRCITGQVMECPKNYALSDGTQITICYPTYTNQTVSFENEEIAIYDGERFLHPTTAKVARNITTRPNNSPPSSGGPPSAIARLGSCGAFVALVWTIVWLGI